jgi:hypothetical protein
MGRKGVMRNTVKMAGMRFLIIKVVNRNRLRDNSRSNALGFLCVARFAKSLCFLNNIFLPIQLFSSRVVSGTKLKNSTSLFRRMVRSMDVVKGD